MEVIDPYILNVLNFIKAVCLLPLIILGILYLASAVSLNLNEMKEKDETRKRTRSKHPTD